MSDTTLFDNPTAYPVRSLSPAPAGVSYTTIIGITINQAQPDQPKDDHGWPRLLHHPLRDSCNY